MSERNEPSPKLAVPPQLRPFNARDVPRVRGELEPLVVTEVAAGNIESAARSSTSAMKELVNLAAAVKVRQVQAFFP
jgi:hypothetical protein